MLHSRNKKANKVYNRTNNFVDLKSNLALDSNKSQTLSPCKRSEQGGSKFNRQKKSTCTLNRPYFSGRARELKMVILQKIMSNFFIFLSSALAARASRVGVERHNQSPFMWSPNRRICNVAKNETLLPLQMRVVTFHSKPNFQWERKINGFNLFGCELIGTYTTIRYHATFG